MRCFREAGIAMMRERGLGAESGAEMAHLRAKRRQDGADLTLFFRARFGLSS